jgi:hypothetical protein
MTTEIDARVQKLFDKLLAKKKEVESLEKPSSNKTNLSFPFDMLKSERMNIQTASSEQIVHALAFLITKAQAYEEACKFLEVKIPFVWGGSSFDDWKQDMSARVSRLNIAEKKKELAELEVKINNVVSPEQRRLMEIDALTKALA